MALREARAILGAAFAEPDDVKIARMLRAAGGYATRAFRVTTGEKSHSPCEIFRTAKRQTALEFA